MNNFEYSIDDLNRRLVEIINRKYEELHLGLDYSKIFSKIRDFEANAIGQIGEEFARQVCRDLTSIEQNDKDSIHTEYDIKTTSRIEIEVKTARKGRNNDTFQFNGIEPRRNYNYLLCIGICEDEVKYKMFSHECIKYEHGKRKYFVEEGDFKKQLVKMNPDNLVSYKLTINLRDLKPINELPNELKRHLNA